MPKAPAPKTQDCMVDLETLGRVPGCALLSIGAVMFNPATQELGDEFYVVVTRDDPLFEKLGLHVDPATLLWWEGQSDGARAVFADAANKRKSKGIGRALEMFNDFIAPVGKRSVRIWGNGADFDNAILATAMRLANREPGWEFWNGRCFRTLKNLHKDVKAPEMPTVAHNALADAKAQAVHALAIFKHMTLRERQASDRSGVES